MSWWAWAIVAGGALFACATAIVLWLLCTGRAEQARAVAGFLPDCLVLSRRLLRDPRVPRRRKLLVAALIAYMAMPFDLVLDFIPVIGQLDDAILAALVLRSLMRAGGADVVREHWPGPPGSLAVILALGFGRDAQARDRRSLPPLEPAAQAPDGSRATPRTPTRT